MEFTNTTERGMSLGAVFSRIEAFMMKEPHANYELIIGTDSQVHRGFTKLITGIIIRRENKGAWACYRQVIIPREITSVRDKLSTETSLSEEIACYFDDDKRRQLEDIILPYIYQNASLEVSIHIDAGHDKLVSKTAFYVPEMVDRVESLGWLPVIKPYSYCASSYADRYSKSSKIPVI
ncbi:ribonuclease H-like YkuK family protein [Paenibacillus mendelii]|uniref:Ribonuclease H-like YkuK family protein n=1 Tax=Paenibacillus mendelii TaxID=206163 RepID=A0ABV6J763_9BACL|nr:ribonuclease H-like YkuK family protein [Paenibacillus mendelii]MCQ6562068.1 ribonuclease H-like YkuK family protein [Paenibacillus mendelii]